MKTIVEQIKEMIALSDIERYQAMIENDREGKTLSKEMQQEVVAKSVQAAVDLYSYLVEQYTDLLTVEEYLKKLNMVVSFSHVVGFRSYVAIYDHSRREIDLNLSALSLIQRNVEKHQLEELIEIEKLKEVAYFHEIFHNLEMTLDNVFTNEKRFNYKILGFFNQKKRLNIASEIGATHFAKIASKLSHSPLLFEEVLLVKEEVKV